MENFEFKSQICTTKEQSERLLKLGLKKETADCHWFYHDEHWEIKIGFDLVCCENLYPKYYIPAWSLGRLLEVMRMKASSQVVSLDDTFDKLIEGIETRIKEGYFNKNYLEENK